MYIYNVYYYSKPSCHSKYVNLTFQILSSEEFLNRNVTSYPKSFADLVQLVGVVLTFTPRHCVGEEIAVFS